MNSIVKGDSADRISANRIFTLGHSNHTIEDFLSLLRAHRIAAVADVRSQPYSRLPHFAREQLESYLLAAGIRYLFLGRELGARRDEPEAYANGHADYDRIARLPAFARGIDRLLNEPLGRVALMCAEKEPLDCHRTILVSRHLAGRGVPVRHILADGTVEDHADSGRRLIKLLRIVPDLFDQDFSESHLLDRAFAQRAREIAFEPRDEGEGVP